MDNRELTEKESKRLKKREEHVQRELRIFLRYGVKRSKIVPYCHLNNIISLMF